MGSDPMPTDAVVGALEAGMLRATSMGRCGCPDCLARVGMLSLELPAILRATLPHWSAEDKQWVLGELVKERDAVQKARHAAQREADAAYLDEARARLAPTPEETRDG